MNLKDSEKLMCLKLSINRCFTMIIRKLTLTKRSYKAVIILLSSFIVNVHTIFAQPIRKFYSLETILSVIEKQNPLLLSYQNKISAANEIVKGAKSWMPPMIGAGIGDMPYRLNGGGLMISAEQSIPNFKKLQTKENYLNSMSVLHSNDEGYVKNQLLATAKVAYYERFIAEKRLKIIQENITLMKFIIDISESRIAYNKSDLESIYKAKAKLYSFEAMQAHEQNSIKELLTTLNYLMNEDVNSSFDIDSNLTLKNYNFQELDTLKINVEAKRSDIQKINNSIASMKLNQSMILSRAYPDFGIKVEHNKMFHDQSQFFIMGHVTIPIVPWSSKEYKAESKAIEFEIEAMKQEKENAINMANQMIKMNLLMLNAEHVEVDNYIGKIIPALKKNFDINLLSYQQNTNDLLFTLMAIEELQMAQMEYLYHLEQAFKAEVEYEKEMEQR